MNPRECPGYPDTFWPDLKLGYLAPSKGGKNPRIVRKIQIPEIPQKGKILKGKVNTLKYN